MRIRGYAPVTPCWVELASGDPAASVTFYGGLFGWQATPTEVGSTAFTLRDLVAAGVVAAGGQPAAWLTYISTEDVDATAAAVTEAGGTVLRPPTDVGTRGRMAVFTDPEGAAFGAWQRGSFAGAQVASEPDALCWSEIVTRDTDRAAAFYGKIFGWVEQRGALAPGFDYREWYVDNRVVAGMSPMDDRYPAEVPAHWRTIFEVADCAATAARCAELGGQVVVGPMDVVVGQYAQLLDPQGASVGVIELVPQLRMSR